MIHSLRHWNVLGHLHPDLKEVQCSLDPQVSRPRIDTRFELFVIRAAGVQNDGQLDRSLLPPHPSENVQAAGVWQLQIKYDQSRQLLLKILNRRAGRADDVRTIPNSAE